MPTAAVGMFFPENSYAVHASVPMVPATPIVESL
jgi:hypothetical protein